MYFGTPPTPPTPRYDILCVGQEGRVSDSITVLPEHVTQILFTTRMGLIHKRTK